MDQQAEALALAGERQKALKVPSESFGQNKASCYSPTVSLVYLLREFLLWTLESDDASGKTSAGGELLSAE